jgi:hypothetical protein
MTTDRVRVVGAGVGGLGPRPVGALAPDPRHLDPLIQTLDAR